MKKVTGKEIYSEEIVWAYVRTLSKNLFLVPLCWRLVVLSFIDGWANFKDVLWFVDAAKDQEKKEEKGREDKLGRKNMEEIQCSVSPPFLLSLQCTIHHWSGRELQTNWNSKIFHCLSAHTLSVTPSSPRNLFFHFAISPLPSFFIPSFFWGKWLKVTLRTSMVCVYKYELEYYILI